MSEVVDQPIVEGTGDGVSGSADVAVAPTPAVPEYTPNYKYTVLDQEKEFPDYIRQAIKDAETEKKIREVYEKVDGFDHVKQRRDFIETEHKQYKDNWGPVVKRAQTWWTAKEKKDFESLFEDMGIPEEDLFRYVHQRLTLKQDPAQLQQHQQSRQTQLQSQQLQEQAASFRQQQEQFAQERRGWELELQLSKPEVASIIQDFEARVGQPGAFRQEVIRRGAAYSAMGQGDLPAEQVVQETLRVIGWQSQNQTPPPSVAPPRPATLPNIQGKGGSPAKVVPKTLDEMRKRAVELRNSGN